MPAPQTVAASNRLLRIGCFLAGMALCAGGAALSLRALAGDLAITEALRLDALALMQADESEGRELARKAGDLTRQAVLWNPASGRARLTRARNLALEGRFDEAREEALHSNELIASAATFRQMAWIFLETSDRAEALKWFEAALAIRPDDPEAHERRVWIAKLDLNEAQDPSERDRHLEEMLSTLRDLENHTVFNPNAGYLWSQYWHERARVSRQPLHYRAGLRSAGLAISRPNPRGYTLLYSNREMSLIINYFSMGARGYPVVEDRPFQTEREVDLRTLRF